MEEFLTITDDDIRELDLANDRTNWSELMKKGCLPGRIKPGQRDKIRPFDQVNRSTSMPEGTLRLPFSEEYPF